MFHAIDSHPAIDRFVADAVLVLMPYGFGDVATVGPAG